MKVRNTYQDTSRATAYAELDFGGTYHLAFRDLPELLKKHVRGNKAVDFGCGTGRSTRFLKELGYHTIGLDVAQEMVRIAQQNDPAGDYRVIQDGDFSSIPSGSCHLILAAFPFDNISGKDRRVRLFSGLRSLLAENGCLINIVSTPEIYRHEWVTFSTQDFPENQRAKPGEIVRIVTTAYSDARAVEDVLWPDYSYREAYEAAGLEVLQMERPLARGNEGIAWKSETEVAPWSIYVLRAT